MFPFLSNESKSLVVHMISSELVVSFCWQWANETVLVRVGQTDRGALVLRHRWNEWSQMKPWWLAAESTPTLPITQIARRSLRWDPAGCSPPPPFRSRAPPRVPATHQYSLKAQLAECIAPREGAPLLSKWNITKMSFVKISPKTVGSGRAGSPRRRAPPAVRSPRPGRARLPRGAARVAPAVASVRPGSSRASRRLPSLLAAFRSQQTLSRELCELVMCCDCENLQRWVAGLALGAWLWKKCYIIFSDSVHVWKVA